MRIRPMPLFLRRLSLARESRSRYAQKLSRVDAYEELKYLTGQDFGNDVARWRAWIKQHMTLDGRRKQSKD
jgi:hypothetical protein